MTNEFKKTSSNKDQTVYTLESASAGGTSSGSIASVSSPMGGAQKRGQIVTSGTEKKIPPSTPRNFVAKNAKTGGAGAHKDKKKSEKQGTIKHKKPFMESLRNQISQLKAKLAESVVCPQCKTNPCCCDDDDSHGFVTEADSEYGKAGMNRPWGNRDPNNANASHAEMAKKHREYAEKMRAVGQHGLAASAEVQAKEHDRLAKEEPAEQGVAEDGYDPSKPANYTLGHAPDAEYVYSIYRDGEKEGTYHSIDQVKRIVANMKKNSPHTEYKVKRSPRNKMAGPVGQLPESGVAEGIGQDMAKLGGIAALGIGAGLAGNYYDQQQPRVDVGGQKAYLIQHPGWGRIPDNAMTLQGKDGKTYTVWASKGKGSTQYYATPADKQQGAAEGAPELLKAEMPLVRHIEQELAKGGWTKDDPEYKKAFSSSLAYYRKFGNAGQFKEQGVAEGLDPEKRSRLDDLIGMYRDSTDPADYSDYEYEYPENVLNMIRAEFGDRIASQIEAGTYKMHFPRKDHDRGYDPMSWREPIARQTKAGKMYKQDSDFRKNGIKSRYRLSGKSATEGVADAGKKQVQDRKTGQWYDPDEKFKELQKNPDYIAQMKRMGREEGKGWPKRKEKGVDEGDAYMESLNVMLERQLDPTMDLDTWNDNFQNADPQKYHQFKNKTSEKKK